MPCNGQEETSIGGPESLWLLPAAAVSAWCLESPHVRLTVVRQDEVRLGRGWDDSVVSAFASQLQTLLLN